MHYTTEDLNMFAKHGMDGSLLDRFLHLKTYLLNKTLQHENHFSETPKS